MYSVYGANKKMHALAFCVCNVAEHREDLFSLLLGIWVSGITVGSAPSSEMVHISYIG